MAKVLTAKAVEAMKPDPRRRLEVPDAAFPGLYLVVQPSGAKSWAFRYRARRPKPRKMTLGRYPALSLAATPARRRPGGASRRTRHRSGRREDRGQGRGAVASDTERDKVKTLIDQFDKRHLSQDQERAARPPVPRPLRRLRHGASATCRRSPSATCSTCSTRSWIAGTPTTANRVLAHTRKFFNWCVERDVIERAPTDGVKPPSEGTPRRTGSSADDEMRWLWKATEAEGQPFGPLARVLLLTGQRLGEGVGHDRPEISGGVWHLSAARTKNGRAHDVPLSEAARWTSWPA